MEKNNSKYLWELFGIECLDGWRNLIIPLFKYIEKYNKNKHETQKIHVLQVKEKFAGLRFYVDRGTDEFYKMIDNAEQESYKVCEECGSREEVGLLYIRGWYYTRCKKHAQELVNKRNIEGKFKINNEIITLYPENE